MYIQQDLASSLTKDGLEITGFIDLGTEANNNRILRDGKESAKLASQVLQFVYLGANGFRFPVAHFPSNSANAADIYINMWKVIQKLHDFEFNVHAVVMDGGANNRRLITMHFDSWAHAVKCQFTTKSPFNPEIIVTFIMDYSHIMKKIRNNLLKSGNEKEHSKLITLNNDSKIEWQDWEDAFNWDRGNLVRIHRKLTRKHIKLDNSSKMRNFLAEQVLDVDMLNLFRHYKVALGPYGSRLDGAIELLQYTSIMVEIFRDTRPVLDSLDDRLNHLSSAQKWFTAWEKGREAKLKPVAEGGERTAKSKMLFSPQTRQDITCCIVGFLALIKRTQGTVTFKPGLVNSDIVENIFCSQRVICGGANDNPNFKKYCHNLSAIILVQKLRSPKSNTGGKDNSKAYAIQLPPRRKCKRNGKHKP